MSNQAGFKPPDLDDNGNPLPSNDAPPDLDDYGNPVTPTQSFGSQVWQAINEPLTTLPSTIGKGISGLIDKIPVMEQTGQGGFRDFVAKDLAQARGFFSGSTEAAGDVASSLTSPLNLGVAAATGGSNLALRAGLPQVARGLQLGARAASVPGAIHGGMEVTRPDATMAERGIGLTEMAGNIAGGMHVPNVKGPILSRAWPTPETASTGGIPGSMDLPVTPPTGAIPDVIPPPRQVGENVSRVVVKKSANTMDIITKLTDEGFIASEVDAKTGGIVMIRPPKPTNTPITPTIPGEPTPLQPPGPQTITPPIPLRGMDPNLNMGQGFAEPPIGIPKTSPLGEGGVEPDISGLLAQFKQSMDADALRRNQPPIDMPTELPIGPVEPPPNMPHEFSQDMAFTPDEMVPTQFPPMENSPFENPFDPRISGLPPRPDDFTSQVLGEQMPTELTPSSGMPHWGPAETTGRFPGDESFDIGNIGNEPIDLNQSLIPEPRTIQPEEWGDWGGLEKDIPTLVPDETGSHVAAPDSFDMEPQFQQPQGNRLSDRWQAIVDELDAEGAPDSAYRDILSTGGKDSLKRGETWRSRVRKYIETDRKRGEELANEDVDMTPQFAKTETGQAKIGVDVKHAAGELTTGYSNPLPGIMVREGLQNALDAVRGLGLDGKVDVEIRRGDSGSTNPDLQKNELIIADNGTGMSPEELFTVYTDLHSSGKAKDPNATGGKGVGKATYMLGGEHFHVETVKEINGVKIKSEFSGTPEDLLAGFDIDTMEVPIDTPTGTKFTTRLKEGQEYYEMRNSLDNVVKYSRGKESTINVKRNNFSDIESSQLSKADDKHVIRNVDLDGKNNKLDAYIASDATMGSRGDINVIYLNNGMYQFNDYMYLGETVNGVPNEIIVDLKPKVEEGTTEYAFPVQRESVKGKIKEQIETLLKEKIVNPLASDKVKNLTKLWKQMETVKKTSKNALKREAVFFDPGDRLTSVEKKAMTNNLTVWKMQGIFDSMIDDILKASGRPGWSERVVRTGITLDPNMAGVHIPNPGAAKGAESAILVNPFIRLENSTPRQAAMDMIVTVLHEAAHVGTKADKMDPNIKLDIGDVDDPRVGTYLQTYIKETIQQGGLDAGHQIDFIHRLGELYAKTGTRTALHYADELESLLQGFHTQVGAKSGSYSSEVQDLLSIYSESRGRTATSEDILSGTGVRQQIRGGGEGNIPGADRPDGTGTPGESGAVWIKQPTPDTVKLAIQAGYKFSGETRGDGAWRFTKDGVPPRKPPILESEVGGHRPRGTTSNKGSHVVEAYNLGRSLQAAWDVSAPFRQGIGLVHKKEFWTSLPTMFKAYASEEGFKGAMDAIKERPLFKVRTNAQDKQFPSFADDAGLKLTSLDEGINLREEMIISKLAEKVPLVRRSNRAYTAFLNSIRADVFESLVTDAKVFGADAKVNTVLARELAAFVNNASGRGDLKALDKHAVLLGQLLFSPRLIASRLQMLNPQNYVMGHPAVRKEYLKSLFAIAMVGNTVGQLGKMAGGTVSNDPNSADFGKIKIGDTRLDPFGGFQQYIVAANRLIRPNSVAVGERTDTGIVPLDMATGMAATGGQRLTSSNNPDSSYDLWNPERPFDPVHMDVIERFGRGKAHPVIGFAWSLLKGRKEMSGQPMNFSTMNPVENAIAKQFIPLIVQDIEELSKHDPQLIPILGPLAALGMGVQSYSPD